MPGVTAARAVRLALAALPGLAIAGVVVADMSVGSSVVLGLVVVAPLLAANVAGPGLTAAYGVAAFVAAVVLGIIDDTFEPGDARNAQLVRLGVIAVMGLLAVFLSRYRIQREQRLTQVIKVAEAAQRAILLPVPERLGRVRVAVHYESAAREALIGGDMYGFVLTDHGLRVLVGDVRGKGLDAVRLSAQVLATFRERAGDNPDLGTLLDRLDATVAHVAETDEDFVTAVLVQIGGDGVMTVVNAGHPAPLLLSGDVARLLDVDPPRPPLGLGGRSGTLTTSIAPRDRLLLYTDGLTEARNPRTRAFLPAQQIVAALRARDAVGDAVNELRQDVLQWSGGALHDDIALVLLEYQGEAPEDREVTGRGAASSLR
jgi:sigma-B regulation protein RsbU (phosphoserine phosphatase)